MTTPSIVIAAARRTPIGAFQALVKLMIRSPKNANLNS